MNTSGRIFDLAKWDIETFDVVGFTSSLDVGLPLLSAWLYLKASRCIPSIIRTWWNESRDRALTLSVEGYTEKFYTPILLSKEFVLLGMLSLPNISVKVVKSTLEVVASYNIEDSALDMVIKLPRSFPLRLVEVNSTSPLTGVPEQKWRSWLLSSQAVLSAQNGSLGDAIAVFERNVSGHFEGVEECAICYSIIGLDRTVPSKACRTCKHKFHGGCLFKARIFRLVLDRG